MLTLEEKKAKEGAGEDEGEEREIVLPLRWRSLLNDC
jgi:hypothetical protein